MNEDSYPESSMAMRYWAIVCLEGNHKKNGVLGWIKCRDPSSHEDYDIVGAGFSAFEIGSSDPQVIQNRLKSLNAAQLAPALRLR